jgi:hypothetical protein
MLLNMEVSMNENNPSLFLQPTMLNVTLLEFQTNLDYSSMLVAGFRDPLKVDP